MHAIPTTRRHRLIIAAIIGIVSGLVCYFIQVRYGRGAGDLGYVMRLFNDLIHGTDPYSFPVSITPMSYPLTAALAVAPFTLLPAEVAAGTFFGLSSALFVIALTHRGQWWPLLTLLSFIYWQSLFVVQWSPLLYTVAIYPMLLPITLCKPTLGLPIALTRLTRRRFIACAVFGAVSLLILPTWPIGWLNHQADPAQYVPPLLTLPFGPLLFLSLARFRDRRAWFLLILSAMPQRLWYDMLLVFLIPQTPRQLIALVLGSWIALWLWLWLFPALAGTLVVLLIYLPAVAFVLWPNALGLSKSPASLNANGAR